MKMSISTKLGSTFICNYQERRECFLSSRELKGCQKIWKSREEGAEMLVLSLPLNTEIASNLCTLKTNTRDSHLGEAYLYLNCQGAKLAYE